MATTTGKRLQCSGPKSINSTITDQTQRQGVSMIREETIPDSYRKFIKPATKKRLVATPQLDKVGENIDGFIDTYMFTLFLPRIDRFHNLMLFFLHILRLLAHCIAVTAVHNDITESNQPGMFEAITKNRSV